MRVPQNHYLHLYAADLVRAPDGQWWVLADRTQAPSGTGYALENRIGTVLLFPVFDTLTGGGQNAQYNIIGWVGFHLDSYDVHGNNAGLQAPNRYLYAVFALEKALYGLSWLWWMARSEAHLATVFGKSMTNWVPPPGALVTAIAPPSPSTMFLAIGRPRPVPPRLVVKYGSKMCARSVAEMPAPESVTTGLTRSPLA